MVLKKLNKLKLLLVHLLVAFSFTGCKTATNVATNNQENEPILIEASEPEYKYSANSIDRTSAESVVNGFLGAIQNKDFITAKSLINLNDDTFLSNEDLEYVIRRTKIGYMIGNPGAPINNPKFTEANGTAEYTFYTTETADYAYIATIKLELNDQNLWSINKENFVKDEMTLYVPKGVRLFINDAEVPEVYKVKSENNLDIYTVIDIARREFTTTIVSSIFGQIKGTLDVPIYDESDRYNADNQNVGPVEVNRIVTPELFEELGNRVMDIYNSVYVLMDNEASAEELNQFIYDKKNYKFFEQYYQQSLKTRIGVYNNDTVVGHLFTNVEMLEFWQNPSVSSYVFSNDTIVLNTIMKIRWTNNSINESESEMISAGVKLTKAPGGEWLLNDITKGAWTTLTNGLDESQGVDAW